MAKEKSTGNPADGRSRVWACIVYPESAPENWRDVLDDAHIPYAISPLHDRDENADKTPKKPHWHVLFICEGKKSQEQMDELSKLVNGTICQRVQSAKGMARYLIHQDNPEKAQYSKNDIECHGGLDIGPYLINNAATQRELSKQIVTYILENGTEDIIDLIAYAAMNDDEWYDEIRHNTIFYSAVVRSQWQKNAKARATLAQRDAEEKKAKFDAFNERHPEE
jgi:hypothetical protein